MEPGAIADEIFQRDWIGQPRVAANVPIHVQCQTVFGISDVRAVPRRTQRHLSWHMAFPKGHGLPKKPYLGSIAAIKMSCCRQAIGPSSDDRNIGLFHSTSFPLRIDGQWPHGPIAER